MKKNITKRRRYKNRRRILRGGNIDNDADQLIESLRGYDHNSMIKILENIKDSPTFRTALETQNSEFETIKSTCNYTDSFANFVDEMITTAVNTLRNEPTQTSEELKQKLTPDTISGLLPENVDLDALLNNLMERYAKAKVGPCLSVEGRKATLWHRASVDPNSRKQRFPLRKGGSRRKNKKSKRTRRTHRGGGLEFLGALVVVGVVMVLWVKYKEWRREKNDEVTFIIKGDRDFE